MSRLLLKTIEELWFYHMLSYLLVIVYKDCIKDNASMLRVCSKIYSLIWVGFLFVFTIYMLVVYYFTHHYIGVLMGHQVMTAAPLFISNHSYCVRVLVF